MTVIERFFRSGGFDQSVEHLLIGFIIASCAAMNRIFVALSFLFFISCNQAKQPVQQEAIDTIEVPAPESAVQAPARALDPITFIREKVEKINTMKLETKHFEFMCDEKMMVITPCQNPGRNEGNTMPLI